MYRLLIVDDEHHIVNWLVSLFESIPDLELEISKAYTGEAALSIMESQKTDILLLDIQMPGLNGLQVAEKILLSQPTTYIIFLTGYSDFEYLYQASQMEHISYLLKSEKDGRIVEQVRDCIARLEQDRQNALLYDQATSHDLLLKHLFQTQFLREIILGKPVSEIRHSIHRFQISPIIRMKEPLYLCYMKLADSHADEQPDYQSLCCQMPLLMNGLSPNMEQFAIIPTGINSFLWLLQPPCSLSKNMLSPEIWLKYLLEDLIFACQHTFSCFCALLFYTEQITWDMVYPVWQQLRDYDSQKLPRTMIDGFLTVIGEKDLSTLHVQSQPVNNDIACESLLAKLQNHLYQCNFPCYQETLKSLCNILCLEKSMHSLRSLEIYMKISSLLITYINHYHLQEKIALRINLFSLYNLDNFNSWQDASVYLSALSHSLFQELDSHEKDMKLELISYVKQFITDHLSENLSLGVLSQHFNYNSSYLSHLFKQATGTGLTEYIARSRIEKANYLLQNTQESVSVIAEQVGYDTAQYFSYAYKKYTGITPSEYRLLSNK